MTQVVIYRYMEKSEQYESSIAEQEQINIGYVKKIQPPPKQDPLKFASITEIRSFQRSSQLYNQKLAQSRPLLFNNQDSLAPSQLHFQSQNDRQQLIVDGKNKGASNLLQIFEDRWTLKVQVSNICRENKLAMQVKDLKKKAILQLRNMGNNRQRHAVGFKYSLSLNETNLLIRVFVQLEGEFKVWKEMDVPLSENKFRFQILEYNNEQTDIKVNDFLFHLLLKMPYHEQKQYCLVHQGKANIEKVQFWSRMEKKDVQSKETYCTNECRLI